MCHYTHFTTEEREKSRVLKAQARQQHLLLRRNGRRVKKNIKKKCGFESSPEHKPLFADAFILGLRNQIQCSFT